jgi:hypothetical protein
VVHVLVCAVVHVLVPARTGGGVLVMLLLAVVHGVVVVLAVVGGVVLVLAVVHGVVVVLAVVGDVVLVYAVVVAVQLRRLSALSRVPAVHLDLRQLRARAMQRRLDRVGTSQVDANPRPRHLVPDPLDRLVQFWSRGTADR